MRSFEREGGLTGVVAGWLRRGIWVFAEARVREMWKCVLVGMYSRGERLGLAVFASFVFWLVVRVVVWVKASFGHRGCGIISVQSDSLIHTTVHVHVSIVLILHSLHMYTVLRRAAYNFIIQIGDVDAQRSQNILLGIFTPSTCYTPTTSPSATS